MIHRIKKFIKDRNATQYAVIKNTGWLFFGEIGSRAARSVLAIIAARMLGASGLGEWSYAMALGGFLMFFEDAGIGLFVTREFTKDTEKKKEVFGTALVLKLILLGAATLLILGVGPFISSIPEASTILPVVAIVLIFDSLRGFFFSISRAEEKMHVESRTQLITSLLVVGFGLLFLLISPTPLSLALGYALGGAIGFLIIFLSVRKYIPNLISSFSKKLFKHIFFSAWPFTILAISNVVMFNTDTLLLGKFSNVTEVGWYNAATRIVQIFYIIPALFSVVTFPVLVKKATGPGGLKFALRKSLLLMTVVMIPLILVLTLGSTLIINTVFGKEYAPAALPLAIMAFSFIPVFIGTMLNNAVFALDKQKKFVLPNIVGIIMNAGLNLILIPRLHATGAAIATVISLSAVTLITVIQLRTTNKNL